MPELSSLVVFNLVQFVLEFCVALSEYAMELRLVSDLIEFEWRARAENRHVFAEVPVVRIVQTVLDKISHEHLDSFGPLFSRAKRICRHHGVFFELLLSVLRERIRSLLPITLARRLDILP